MLRVSDNLMLAFQQAADKGLQQEILDKSRVNNAPLSRSDLEERLKVARSLGFVHRHHLARFCLEVPLCMYNSLAKDPIWQDALNYPGRDGDHRLELILAHVDTSRTSEEIS